MNWSGATCPCCSGLMTNEDIRFEGKSGNIRRNPYHNGYGDKGKTYRLPTAAEVEIIGKINASSAFADIPYGQLYENTPSGGNGASRAFSVQGYGMMQWKDLFSNRQLFTLAKYVKHTRDIFPILSDHYQSADWFEAISSFLALAIDRLANCGSILCIWNMEKRTKLSKPLFDLLCRSLGLCGI